MKDYVEKYGFMADFYYIPSYYHTGKTGIHIRRMPLCLLK